MTILTSKKPLIPPTPKQLNYLEILFNELGFTINSREVFMSNEFNRPVKGLDGIGKFEASFIIERLKAMREVQRERQEREHEH